MRLFMLAWVVLAAGILSGQQLPQPDRLGEVRDFHSWTKVNPKPVEITPVMDARCQISPDELKKRQSDPHVGKTITVWVNNVGQKAMLEGGKFPVGSAIVKEKREGKDGPVELSTVMIKRPKGYNSACGDWEFAVLDKTGEKVEARGKIQTCAACHIEKAKLDYVFRSYVPGRVPPTPPMRF